MPPRRIGGGDVQLYCTCTHVLNSKDMLDDLSSSNLVPIPCPPAMHTCSLVVLTAQHARGSLRAAAHMHAAHMHPRASGPEPLMADTITCMIAHCVHMVCMLMWTSRLDLDTYVISAQLLLPMHSEF
jgi:hypothetical protein